MSVKITVTGGSFLIDEQDLPLLEGKTVWVEQNQHSTTPYVSCKPRGTRKRFFLHRLIMNPNPGFIVDHINHDGTDNRRINLRICSCADNLRNARKSRFPRTSIYKGVFKATLLKTWSAEIQCKDKKYRLGQFKSEVDAALAYDAAAIRLFGEFAYLNFPKKITDEQATVNH